MEIITILEQAKALIESKSTWVKLVDAADKNDMAVLPEDINATGWSAHGALERIRFENNLKRDDYAYLGAFNLVLAQMKKINNFDFTAWETIGHHNDHMTHEEVIFAFDRAIQSLNKKNN